MIVAELTGEARHHAKWRPLTEDEEASAMAELRALAGGRGDLLAEVAGIFEGTSEGELDEPLVRSAARLCRLGGCRRDPDPPVGRGRTTPGRGCPQAAAWVPIDRSPVTRWPGFLVCWPGNEDKRGPRCGRHRAEPAGRHPRPGRSHRHRPGPQPPTRHRPLLPLRLDHNRARPGRKPAVRPVPRRRNLTTCQDRQGRRAGLRRPPISGHLLAGLLTSPHSGPPLPFCSQNRTRPSLRRLTSRLGQLPRSAFSSRLAHGIRTGQPHRAWARAMPASVPRGRAWTARSSGPGRGRLGRVL